MLVISNDIRPKLREAYNHAKLLGPDVVKQFLRQLLWCHRYGANTGEGTDPEVRKQCEFRLYPDFAPFSFTFTFSRRGKFAFNGGLIYQGPECPGDGSFPSLSVSLHRNTGWFIHT